MLCGCYMISVWFISFSSIFGFWYFEWFSATEKNSKKFDESKDRDSTSHAYHYSPKQALGYVQPSQTI